MFRPALAAAAALIATTVPAFAQGAPVADAAPAPLAEPSYGMRLPDGWRAGDFYIGNYAALGLNAPASGFGWSRYGDYAVLTDRWGRVYDWRKGIDWTAARNADHRMAHWNAADPGAIATTDYAPVAAVTPMPAAPACNVCSANGGQPIVTETTTVTYERVPVYTRRASYAAPRKTWRPAPRRTVRTVRPAPATCAF